MTVFEMIGHCFALLYVGGSPGASSTWSRKANSCWAREGNGFPLSDYIGSHSASVGNGVLVRIIRGSRGSFREETYCRP